MKIALVISILMAAVSATILSNPERKVPRALVSPYLCPASKLDNSHLP